MNDFRNFLHNNNFHNQSFTAINNADALRNASVHYTVMRSLLQKWRFPIILTWIFPLSLQPNLNTFVNGSILHSNGVDNEGGDGGYSIPPYQSSLYACTNPNLSNGLATATTSNGFLQSGRPLMHSDTRNSMSKDAQNFYFQRSVQSLGQPLWIYTFLISTLL